MELQHKILRLDLNEKCPGCGGGHRITQKSLPRVDQDEFSHSSDLEPKSWSTQNDLEIIEKRFLSGERRYTDLKYAQWFPTILNLVKEVRELREKYKEACDFRTSFDDPKEKS